MKLQPEILNKKLLLFILILIGFIFILPFILATTIFKFPGEVFIGISHGDYGIYASQIRDVYEGKFFQSDSQLAEYSNRPPVFQILGSTLVGIFARILVNFNLVIAAEAFIVGLLLFVFSYLLMLSFTRSRAWAVLAGFIFISGYPIFIRLIPYSSDGFSKLFKDLFLFDRLPVNPVIASFPYNPLYILFQLISIYLLHKSLLTKRTIYIISAGFISGLLFYTNIFHWAIFFTGLSFLVLFSLLEKDRVSLKILLSIGLIALTVSLPFWVIYWQNSSLDAFKTFGAIHKRYIEYFFSARYLFFAALFFLIAKKKKIETEYLIIAYTLAGVLCLNIQLILGFTLLPNHYTAKLEMFLMLFSTYFLWLFLKEFRLRYKVVRFLWNRRTFLSVFGIVILFSYLISYQIKSAKEGVAESYFLPVKQYELYSWLNKNTPNDSVVLGLDTNYIYSLTSHTHNRLFMSYSGFSLASLPEQIDRICLAYSLLNVRNEVFKQEFNKTDWIGAHFNFLYDFNKYYYRYDSSQYTDNIWQKIQKTDPVRYWYVRYLPFRDRQLILEDCKIQSEYPILKKLTRFKLSYILIGPYEKSINANVDSVSDHIVKMFDNGDYQLYKVI